MYISLTTTVEENLKSFNQFIKTQKDLEDLIEGYAVETYKWGNKGTKTIKDLYQEIENEKAEILIRNKKEFLRKVRVVAINIHYILKNTDGSEILLFLKEVMRIKKDEEGKLLSKNIIKRKHSASVGKKLALNEDVIEGAKDALKYKLSLDIINGLENSKIYFQEEYSPSYPGLLTIYEANEFDLTLTSTQFLPNGYCYEREHDLTILEWMII